MITWNCQLRADLPFPERLGEQGLQVFKVLSNNIRRTTLGIIGRDLFHSASISVDEPYLAFGRTKLAIHVVLAAAVAQSV